MKTVFEHIEYVKGQPHHIRKRVAFSAAAGITALIALTWLGGSFATGAFAIHGGDALAGQPAAAAASNDTNNSLAGAAAALPPSSATVPAHIEIIDTTAAAAPSQKKAEQTVIPF